MSEEYLKKVNTRKETVHDEVYAEENIDVSLRGGPATPVGRPPTTGQGRPPAPGQGTPPAPRYGVDGRNNSLELELEWENPQEYLQDLLE